MQSGESNSSSSSSSKKNKKREERSSRKKMLGDKGAEENDRVGLSEDEGEDDDELIVESPEALRAQRNKMLRNVAIVIAVVIAVCIIVVAIALTQKTTVSTEGVVILVSIDAFRVDYLQRTWLKIPNIRKILANGVRTESLISSFPSKTFPVNIHIIIIYYIHIIIIIYCYYLLLLYINITI